MELLELLLKFLITPALFFGALTYLIRKYIENWFSKEIVKYKANLDTKLVEHKASIDAEYTKKQFEFQTKFSAFHQEQFEMLGQLFGKFVDLQNAASRLSGRSFDGKNISLDPNQKDVENAKSKNIDLNDFYKKKHFYLTNEIVTVIDAFIQEVDTP